MKPAYQLSLMLMTLSSLSPATSSPTGAPVDACPTMKPGHGPDGQTVPSPYIIKLSSGQYSPGSEVTVTIQANAGTTFRGFLVQARLADNSTTSAVGTFRNYADGTKALKCFDADNSAVTHTNNTDKTTVTLTWVAPADQEKLIEFRYTVVQSVNVFWVMQKSERIEYIGGATGLSASIWLTFAALTMAALRV